MIYTKRRPVRRHRFPVLGNFLHDVTNVPAQEAAKDNVPFTNPGVNVMEYEDKFMLQLAVPGYSKKDISINIDGDKLIVSSDREGMHDKGYTLREFNYGSFKRTFTLPEDADAEKIEAKVANGILVVEIPKREEVKPRQITIK